MNITDAIGIMESVAGVTDAATPVGDAWALILNHIHHPPQPVAPLKERPDFVAGYRAGLHDGRLEHEAAADLLEQRHPAPVPVSERLPGHVEQALIKAECALSDIAEGEPEENEGDSAALLSWAEQRAAAVLARIRPVMREHGIRTSEWLPLPANALPLPAGEPQP